MRCQYCDYSHEGVPSLYQEGLESSERYRRVLYRPAVDKDVCSVCWEEGYEAPIVMFAEDIAHLVIEDWDEAEGEVPTYRHEDETY